MPFERAQVELAYGQALRRGGKRRAAATQLQAARDRFAALRAVPFLERCERELRGCGLTPARRSDFDPDKLTAQEQAVARLVAVGMSNRQVAAELFVSVKTVQFHLTHIYAKLGIGVPGRAGRSVPRAIAKQPPRPGSAHVKTLVKASFSSRAW